MIYNYFCIFIHDNFGELKKYSRDPFRLLYTHLRKFRKIFLIFKLKILILHSYNKEPIREMVYKNSLIFMNTITIKTQFLLTIFFVLGGFSRISAQQFDERNVIGKWITTDSIGEFYENSESYAFKTDRIDSLVIYEHRRSIDDSTGVVMCTIIDDLYVYGDNGGLICKKGIVVKIGHISQWYITNVNKLHLIIQGRADLRYVILNMDENTLELETFDGKGRLILKKVASPSSRVSEIKQENHAKDIPIYLVDGRKTDVIPTNGIYIKEGVKRINR